MSPPYIQLHPADRKLLENVWRRSTAQARLAQRSKPQRRYVSRGRTRRRKDLLTYAVEKLIDSIVWLLGKMIAGVLLALERLLWWLAGLILNLFTYLAIRCLGLQRSQHKETGRRWI